MKQTSELPLYDVGPDHSEVGTIDFGPGSGLIGCIAYEYTIPDGIKVIIIFGAPENRVKKIINWSNAMEWAWKEQIKKIMGRLLNSYHERSNIFLHWDPPIEGEHQFEQKYRREYFEKLAPDGFLAFLAELNEDRLFTA